MTRELENKLFEKYPKIFAGKDLPITQNLMSFGCECEDGWFNIIYDFCKKVKDLGFKIKLDSNGINFQKIKELIKANKAPETPLFARKD